MVLNERGINIELMERVINNPQLILEDKKDSALEHRLGIISENKNKVLRVIINKEKNPINVVTAYYDRSMKGKL